MNKDFPNLVEKDFDTLTPPEVERDNRYISRELAKVQIYLGEIQRKYAPLAYEYKVSMARSRARFGSISRPDGKNYTVQQCEDEAFLDNEKLGLELTIIEAEIEVGKGRLNILGKQAELIRSVGASVRTSIETERG